MTYDCELTLISVLSHTINEIGDSIPDISKTTILCDELSVTRSEFYSAAAQRLSVDRVFGVNKYEYNSEKLVEFEGSGYKVLRAYSPKKSRGLDDFESIELVCQFLCPATENWYFLNATYATN